MNISYPDYSISTAEHIDTYPGRPSVSILTRFSSSSSTLFVFRERPSSFPHPCTLSPLPHVSIMYFCGLLNLLTRIQCRGLEVLGSNFKVSACVRNCHFAEWKTCPFRPSVASLPCLRISFVLPSFSSYPTTAAASAIFPGKFAKAFLRLLLLLSVLPTVHSPSPNDPLMCKMCPRWESVAGSPKAQNRSRIIPTLFGHYLGENIVGWPRHFRVHQSVHVGNFLTGQE